jgi:hypothetical protein
MLVASDGDVATSANNGNRRAKLVLRSSPAVVSHTLALLLCPFLNFHHKMANNRIMQFLDA